MGKNDCGRGRGARAGAGTGAGPGTGRRGQEDADLLDLELKEVERAPCNMVGAILEALSGVAGPDVF